MDKKYILKITISGITCDACAKLIKKRILNIEGITGVDINQKNGKTVITSINKIVAGDVSTVLSGLPYKIKGE